MQKTSAWPLALLYAGLIAYASLYPFGEWRDQGIMPWSFLAAPLPRYWTGFDVTANVLGYMPLGVLLSLGVQRGGRPGHAWHAFLLALVLSTALSLLMESLQSYLPMRVPSNVDLALNACGAALGAAVAALLEPLGALDRWSQFRARWFVPQARGALVLLALWPVALLFPAAVPFGLGQVLERAEDALADALAATPFLEWLPVRDLELQPLIPAAEWLCVTLGLLAPCLLGYTIIRPIGRRLVFAVVLLAAGLGASLLSAALSFGPAHAWEWFTAPARAGMISALVMALVLSPISRRVAAALLLLALGIALTVLNQAPTSAYFAQTLQAWEQGRFIRFHGVAQWVGWFWPYAVMLQVLSTLSSREREN